MTAAQHPGPSLRRILSVALLSRLSLNIAVRMAYPFLPAISRGLGIPLTTATTLVSARTALGLLSPIFGRLSDRRGREGILVGALVVFAVGGAICATQGGVWLFLAGFALMGLGKVMFDPPLIAYVSDRVPYARRGRILSLNEFSWAGANLLGLPLVGLLITWRGWQAPFAVLSLLGIVSAVLVYRSFAGGNAPHPAGEGGRSLKCLLKRSPLAALGASALIMGANELFFIVYGAWMEQSFGLGAAGLGLIAASTGVAELIAETLSAGLVDVLGKRRSIVLGALVSSAGYVLVPRLGQLGGVVVGLFCLLLCFEFTMVSTLPLVSELLPETRGTMMSAGAAATSAGRMLAAPLGAIIWQTAGFGANGLAAGLMNVAAVALVIWGIREAAAPAVARHVEQKY